jgi:hypothetical protein
MPMNVHNFNGKIITNSEGKTISVGSYKKTNLKIDVFELPHGLWIKTFVKKMTAKGCDVIDYSDIGNDKIHIVIKLKEEIPEPKKVIDGLDAVEQYLEIYEYLGDNINLVNSEGVVVEYSNYEDVLLDWFKERQHFYKLRIEREIALTKYRILYWENVIRFCLNHEKYNLKTKNNEDSADTVLIKENYTKFNKSKLDNPEYITNYGEIIESGTYNYLHNLTTADLYYNNSKLIREKKLNELQEYLKEMENSVIADNFIGASIWLKEIEKLEKIVEIGFKDGWDIANNEKPYNLDD